MTLSKQETATVPAEALVSKMRPGDNFKAAGPNLIWDRATVDSVSIGTGNRGNGLEPIVAVSQPNGGVMIYYGPFRIENEPTEETLLLFHCGEYSFVKLSPIIYVD